MNTDKIVARILVVALAILAAIGLIGTFVLLLNKIEGNSVAVYVGLAGVPLGAVAALATTKTGSLTGAPEVIQGPPGPPGPQGDTGPMGLSAPMAPANSGLFVPVNSATELFNQPNIVEENPFGTTVITKTDAEKFTITVPEEEKKDTYSPTILGMGV